MEEKQILELKKTLAELQTMYTNDIAKGTSNILLLGGMGTGKTDLVGTTSRYPVLFHSFDPGGSNLRRFKDLRTKGLVVTDSRFEKEEAKKPTAYNLWEKEFFQMRKSGIFEGIGTYCIDSTTTFIRALRNKIARDKGRADQILQIQDWQVLGNIFIDVIKLCTALPCDFILTGHLELIKDDSTGKTILRFSTIPSLKIDIPTLFDEVYVMQAEETSKKISRTLVTQVTGRIEARTRMGGGIFEIREEPDLKYLYKKAGRDYGDNLVLLGK